MLPLKGIRILDMTTFSNYCGMELADHGAEVIKIEMPNSLDSNDPQENYKNRGKKSITLDINRKEGQEILRDLILTADAVIESFPLGTLEKLGLGYEDMSKVKPSLVYGRISGYGSTGEETDTPLSEIVAQAKSGAMHVTGFPENDPTRIGFSIANHYTSSFLTVGIVLGIYTAKETGEGQLVETSLCGSLAAITEDKVITYGATNVDPMRTGNAHPLINPYDILKCKNGYVAMGISTDAQWNKLCKAFDKMEWTTDERYYSNIARGDNYFGDLRNKIENLFLNFTMQEISARCDAILIPGTMCSTTKEALEEPQLYERNMIIEVGGVKMPGRPVKFLGEKEDLLEAAPKLGQDNLSIYASLGIESEKLEVLKKESVI